MEVWVVLPLISVMCFYSSKVEMSSMQRLLMSLNVILKTNSYQCEVIVSMPEKDWIIMFIDLAVISNNISNNILKPISRSINDKEIASTCIELV
jgi:hypothetical protein